MHHYVDRVVLVGTLFIIASCGYYVGYMEKSGVVRLMAFIVMTSLGMLFALLCHSYKRESRLRVFSYLCSAACLLVGSLGICYQLIFVLN